jgi:hypothetical protein
LWYRQPISPFCPRHAPCRPSPQLRPLDRRSRARPAAVGGAGAAVEGHRPPRQHPHRPAEHPSGPRWRAICDGPKSRRSQRTLALPLPLVANCTGTRAPSSASGCWPARSGTTRTWSSPSPTADPSTRRPTTTTGPGCCRRPARAAARRPAHRRHPAAQRERPPAGGHGIARSQPDAHDHGHLRPRDARAREGSRRPDKCPVAARWSQSNCDHDCNQKRVRTRAFARRPWSGGWS